MAKNSPLLQLGHLVLEAIPELRVDHLIHVLGAQCQNYRQQTQHLLILLHHLQRGGGGGGRRIMHAIQLEEVGSVSVVCRYSIFLSNYACTLYTGMFVCIYVYIMCFLTRSCW